VGGEVFPPRHVHVFLDDLIPGGADRHEPGQCLRAATNMLCRRPASGQVQRPGRGEPPIPVVRANPRTVAPGHVDERVRSRQMCGHRNGPVRSLGLDPFDHRGRPIQQQRFLSRSDQIEGRCQQADISPADSLAPESEQDGQSPVAGAREEGRRTWNPKPILHATLLQNPARGVEGGEPHEAEVPHGPRILSTTPKPTRGRELVGTFARPAHRRDELTLLIEESDGGCQSVGDRDRAIVEACRPDRALEEDRVRIGVPGEFQDRSGLDPS
jgi:hypothetical protein